MNEGVTAMRIALLNDDGVAVPHVRAALESLGMHIVHEAACAGFDRAALEASAANVVVVNLGSTGDAIEPVYDLLDDARYRVIFNEADVSGGLSGWDQTRWARHLAAKISGADNIDPPRPDDAEAVPEVPRAAKPLIASVSMVSRQPASGEHAVEPAIDAAGADATATEAMPSITQRATEVADFDVGAQLGGDGALDLSGLDELLSNFDAAIDAAEQRDRDAPNDAVSAEAHDHSQQDSEIDGKPAGRPESHPASMNAAAPIPSGFTLALADDDAPVGAPRLPAPESTSIVAPRMSETWSLTSIDDAPAPAPTSGKAAYTARDIASTGERPASGAPTRPSVAASPAESWLSSLQLEPLAAEESPASRHGDALVASVDRTLSPMPHDEPGSSVIAPLWIVAASHDAADAIVQFADVLTTHVDAVVLIVEQRDGDADAGMPTWTQAIALPLHTPGDGDRLAAGDIVVVPAAALLHVDARGVVAILPADDSFPYRSSLDRMLCAAADTFGAALTAVVLDGAPADALLACHHVVACGGRVYAQDAATCSEPATLAAINASNIASATGSARQLAAMLAAGN